MFVWLTIFWKICCNLADDIFFIFYTIYLMDRQWDSPLQTGGFKLWLYSEQNNHMWLPTGFVLDKW